MDNIKMTDGALTLEKIEHIMELEMAKPLEEMDTELVDMCSLILAKAYNPNFEECKSMEMYRPWENETSESKNITVTKAVSFDDFWMMSKEEEEYFTEENLIRVINKEMKKLWFLRDYCLIHECFLTLSEVYGHTYNNEYEAKSEKFYARIKRLNEFKRKLLRSME